MKLICINNRVSALYRDGESKELILGEVYDGELFINEAEYGTHWWCIFELDSKGINEGWLYPKDAFIPLSEWREQQISSVIND